MTRVLACESWLQGWNLPVLGSGCSFCVALLWTLHLRPHLVKRPRTHQYPKCLIIIDSILVRASRSNWFAALGPRPPVFRGLTIYQQSHLCIMQVSASSNCFACPLHVPSTRGKNKRSTWPSPIPTPWEQCLWPAKGLHLPCKSLAQPAPKMRPEFNPCLPIVKWLQTRI